MSAPITLAPLHLTLFDEQGAHALPYRDEPLSLSALSAQHLEPVTGSAFLWLHINLNEPGAREALNALELDPHLTSALLTSEARPRSRVHGEGVLLNLRGVNLNPGAEPDDMISLRVYMSERVFISLQGRSLRAVRDLLESIKQGRQGSLSGPSALIALLILRLIDRAEPVVGELNERLDELEEQLLAQEHRNARAELAQLRRSAIVLRRYLAPQRDALNTLALESLPWLRQRDRVNIREGSERVSRLAEELDAMRDRALVVQDQLIDLRAEQSNRHASTPPI